MEFAAFTAGKDDDGKRLDRVLRAILDGRTANGRSADSSPAPAVNIFQALRKRLVRLNGSRAEPSTRVHEGDKIEIAGFLISGYGDGLIPLPAPAADLPPAPSLVPASTPRTRLEILFQNEDLLFINKPAGISVQPSAGGKESISRIVREEWESAGPHGSLSFTPAPLHRLDRYTSGVLAISRSARGAAWFSKAIQERTIRKFYLGICTGKLEGDALWEDRLTADSESSGSGFHTVRRTAEAGDKGSLARTQVHPVSQGRRGQNALTLVQYELLTGRKHQIRAQSALHGHPLAGDSAYGGANAGEGPSGGGHFFLHALAMEFPPDNPLSLPERIEAPLPEDFAKAVQFFPPQSLQNSPPGSIIYQ